MTEATSPLISALKEIVGLRNVHTMPAATQSYRTGFRCGSGEILAAIRPQKLVELWRAVSACLAHDAIIIMQAANTGLTGGSTPDGADYDRPVVVVNAMDINTIHLIDDARQVICLPGATLHELEEKLAPFGREPHSVIGSSCIGASVMGGVCNNSGGALIRRGAAYTELALYAQLGEDGVLRLVNHLGLHLEGEPEDILKRLGKGEFSQSDVLPAAGNASDKNYQQHVRNIDDAEPARYNADPRRLFEASGSAGKLILFAVRLDTFPKDKRTATFYIGVKNSDDLTQIRRHILSSSKELPVSAEYLHREAFNLGEVWGKDSFLSIQWFGTRRMPQLFQQKAKADRLAARIGLGTDFSDRWMQRLSRFFPNHLPTRMRQWRDRYEHHLILKVANDEIEPCRAYLSSIFPAAEGDFFECDEQEAKKAFLHRFVIAGAAIRYKLLHRDSVEDIVALDIALPRNTKDWLERLPADIDGQIEHKIYYGHFFCHVFHHDYIVKKGCDLKAFKHAMGELIDARGGEYPAEHNVGHLYEAKPALAEFYRHLDPCNAFNPGVGRTSKRKNWL